MKHLTLNIPEHLDLNGRETKRFGAAKMLESDRRALGQAADLAGLSKSTFAEILADYNVSIINYPASAIARDAAQC